MIRARSRPTAPSRATAIGIAAAVALGGILAARSPDPAVADPSGAASRGAYLEARAADAADALSALGARLAPTREAARRGAALVQAGDEDPAPALNEAADLAEAAAAAADAAAARIEALRGVIASVAPGRHVPQVANGIELSGIADQLRDAADAAASFVERRRAADATLRALGAALRLLEDGDLERALDALDEAATSRRAVAAWERPPPTLPLWLSTTGDLIAAARQMADAALAGDEAALQRAAARYAAAAEDARRADVSLALSLSEAGAGLTATPLRRLARVLAAVEAAEVAVAPLVQGGT